ncbi:MAG: DUF5678 domain-containing protein [Dehalococcoidia bacterium]
MATEVVERLRKQLGTPKQAREDQARFDNDLNYLLSRQQHWREKYPNRWIAIYGQRVVAVADTGERLLGELRRQRLPLKHVIIDFVTESETALVL